MRVILSRLVYWSIIEQWNWPLIWHHWDGCRYTHATMSSNFSAVKYKRLDGCYVTRQTNNWITEGDQYSTNYWWCHLFSKIWTAVLWWKVLELLPFELKVKSFHFLNFTLGRGLARSALTFLTCFCFDLVLEHLQGKCCTEELMPFEDPEFCPTY